MFFVCLFFKNSKLEINFWISLIWKQNSEPSVFLLFFSKPAFWGILRVLVFTWTWNIFLWAFWRIPLGQIFIKFISLKQSLAKISNDLLVAKTKGRSFFCFHSSWSFCCLWQGQAPFSLFFIYYWLLKHLQNKQRLGIKGHFTELHKNHLQQREQNPTPLLVELKAGHPFIHSFI